MKNKKRKKQKVTDEHLAVWALRLVIWYGEAAAVWWKKEGQKVFLKWAKKKGLDFKLLSDDDLGL